VVMGLMNFAVLSVLGIAVLYALEVLHVSETVYGLLITLVAVGGLAGLLATPPVAARLGSGRALLLAIALCPVPLAVAGATSTPLLAALLLMLVGASASVGNVVTTSVRQALIPREMFGRVNGAYRVFVSGLAPLGAFAGGIVAQQISLRAPFFMAAGVCTLLLLAGPWLVRSLPRAEHKTDQTTEPAGTATPLKTPAERQEPRS
jgi:MFS family permease